MTFSDRQRRASEQGRAFEAAVAAMLKFLGWTITAEHARINGCEIDFIAISPNGNIWWIECKGSIDGPVPGSQRGDTVKKAVGVAWFLSQQPGRSEVRYMLLTSHLPKPDTLGESMLTAAESSCLFDAVVAIEHLQAFSADA